jgi:hypothetical protein
MFTPDTGPAFAEALRTIIDKAIVDKRSSEPKRAYLGASMWGDPCERKLGYIYHQTPEDEGTGFPAHVLRIFDMGHDGEARTAEYLKLAGFDLHTNTPDGGQYGFQACDGKLKGHIDGVILGGPDVEGLIWPALWENKELNDKSWNDTVKKGVKLSKPLYYAQAQVYMAYLELPNTLFTTKNRNTGEVHAELIKFDARAAQEASDKAVRVVSSLAPEDLSKCTGDEADSRCRFCNFKLRCWEKSVRANIIIQTQTDKPTWLRKK